VQLTDPARAHQTPNRQPLIGGGGGSGGIGPRGGGGSNSSSSGTASCVKPRDLMLTPDLSPLIHVTTRKPGFPQTAADADVYILHLPTQCTASGSLSAATRAELVAHLGVLRTTGAVMLILTERVLPEADGDVDASVVATARARDLALLQLANEGEMEMADLLDMIDSVGDDVGKLVVTNRLRSRTGVVVALGVRYQMHGVAGGGGGGGTSGGSEMQMETL
jgi:hypothetical protein